MSGERIRELIEAFDHFDNKYKRAEVEEAVTIREEITPHLIRILEELAADPRKYADDEHYANTYAEKEYPQRGNMGKGRHDRLHQPRLYQQDKVQTGRRKNTRSIRREATE